MRQITLKNRNRRNGATFILDDEDYNRFHNLQLYFGSNYRVRVKINEELVYLHREILQLTNPKIGVLFKNNNPRDLRKKNLILKPINEENIGKYTCKNLENLEINRNKKHL